ncbi:MAG: hypothetical protein R6W69_07375 [Anaerolineales bacterium]
MTDETQINLLVDMSYRQNEKAGKALMDNFPALMMNLVISSRCAASSK